MHLRCSEGETRKGPSTPMSVRSDLLVTWDHADLCFKAPSRPYTLYTQCGGSFANPDARQVSGFSFGLLSHSPTAFVLSLLCSFL